MENKKIIVIVTIVIMLCVLGGWCAYYFLIQRNSIEIKGTNGERIDDWKYNASSVKNSNYKRSYVQSLGSSINAESLAMVDIGAVSDSTLGLSVGGAKNIENFRENIKNGYFPISTDITYNGLFYDYYFNTGKVKASEELFSPTYSTAVSKDPISGEYEYYMTVGLNSNIKASDFKRKKLNVVVVMDISGSMSSGFNTYYYDGDGDKEESKSKMQIANESLNLLIDELNGDDRLGIILFDDDAYLAKPMDLIEKTDIDKLKEHVLEVQAKGGTNFESGYSMGTKLLNESGFADDSEYENRIIVITDAMPNIGKTDKDGLAKDVEDNSKEGIYTTFIGVGVDFNTEVIECLSDTKGANYYSVHSSEEFKKIMGEDFDYMVTPLVFDLQLKLDSDVFSIENVYGTDNKDFSDGTIIKVNTLFPSSSKDNGESKGGIILLKLKCNANCGTGLECENIALNVSYKDRDGKAYSNSQSLNFGNVDSENYANTGIRKGIVLARYASLMKNWILYERSDSKEVFYIDSSKGIVDCNYNEEEIYKVLGENERASVKLTVSKEYADLFKAFRDYMKKEIEQIGDMDMMQEIEILNLLCK